MIVLIGSNKGGSGKTTIACNLAVAFAREGKDVCMVDADRQGSAAKWYAEREGAGHQPTLTVVQKYDNISTTLRALDDKYDVVIVDVAGRNSKEMISAAAVADCLICPSQCSQLDLDTLEELQQQMDQVKGINPDLAVYVYHSMASTNNKVIEKEREDFLQYLKEYPDFRPLQSFGHYRKVYRDVFSDGKSVLEADNPNAVIEVENLFKELFNGKAKIAAVG